MTKKYRYLPQPESAPCDECGDGRTKDWPVSMSTRMVGEDGQRTTWDLRRNEDCNHAQVFPANFIELGRGAEGGEALPGFSPHPPPTLPGRS